jgi:polyphosphate kinase
LLDDVIRYCLNDIFYNFNYDKAEAYNIKLTRDAELDIETGCYKKPGKKSFRRNQTKEKRRAGSLGT